MSEPRMKAKKANEVNFIFSGRRLLLVLIDTVIIAAVCMFLDMMSKVSISSLTLYGNLTLLKALALWLCFMVGRTIHRIYASIWRYANTKVYLRMIISDMTATGAYFILGAYCFPDQLYLGFGYMLVASMLILLITLISRFCYQFLYAFRKEFSSFNFVGRLFKDEKNESINKINIAIVGAGNVGASLAEEFILNPNAHYKPYCFIDTDKAKAGYEMNGIPIYPEDNKIVARLAEMPVQEIVIALPDAEPRERERLYNLYSQTECKVKIYDYPLHEDANSDGKRTLREFTVEDLLFREPLKVKSDKTKAFYTGKTVLVTGGGGRWWDNRTNQGKTLFYRGFESFDFGLN